MYYLGRIIIVFCWLYLYVMIGERLFNNPILEDDFTKVDAKLKNVVCKADYSYYITEYICNVVVMYNYNGNNYSQRITRRFDNVPKDYDMFKEYIQYNYHKFDGESEEKYREFVLAYKDSLTPSVENGIYTIEINKANPHFIVNPHGELQKNKHGKLTLLLFVALSTLNFIIILSIFYMNCNTYSNSDNNKKNK